MNSTMSKQGMASIDSTFSLSTPVWTSPKLTIHIWTIAVWTTKPFGFHPIGLLITFELRHLEYKDVCTIQIGLPMTFGPQCTMCSLGSTMALSYFGYSRKNTFSWENNVFEAIFPMFFSEENLKTCFAFHFPALES